MRRDLEQLIELQSLADSSNAANERLQSLPGLHQTLSNRLDAAEQSVAAASAKLEANQSARRELEKDLATVQGRLSRFKDQLMAVKTNKEYQAMQHEIGGAEEEVRAYEDRILEVLLQADSLTADLTAAKQSRDAEQTAVDAAQRELQQEKGRLEVTLSETNEAYRSRAAQIDPAALQLFDKLSTQRKGTAVVEARRGLCTFCHVRLRPQVYNDVMRNDSLIQCESCQRILYHAAQPAAGE